LADVLFGFQNPSGKLPVRLLQLFWLIFLTI
jgi:hypothetical protein